MDFSQALIELKSGNLVRRKQWQEDMFLYLVRGSTFPVNRPPLNEVLPDGMMIEYRSHIDVFFGKTKAGVWDANQADLLADDWEVDVCIS